MLFSTIAFLQSELMVRVEMGMFKTKFEFALDINSATTWVATMLCFTPGCLEQTRYIPLPSFYGLPITNKFNLAAFLIAPNPMLPLPIFHYGGAHYQAAMMGMYVWDEIHFSEDYLVPRNGKLPCGTKCDGSGEEYNTQLPSSEGGQVQGIATVSLVSWCHMQRRRRRLREGWGSRAQGCRSRRRAKDSLLPADFDLEIRLP